MVKVAASAGAPLELGKDPCTCLRALIVRNPPRCFLRHRSTLRLRYREHFNVAVPMVVAEAGAAGVEVGDGQRAASRGHVRSVERSASNVRVVHPSCRCFVDLVAAAVSVSVLIFLVTVLPPPRRRGGGLDARAPPHHAGRRDRGLVVNAVLLLTMDVVVLRWRCDARRPTEALAGAKVKEASSGGSPSCTRIVIPSAVCLSEKSSVTLKTR